MHVVHLIDQELLVSCTLKIVKAPQVRCLGILFALFLTHSLQHKLEVLKTHRHFFDIVCVYYIGLPRQDALFLIPRIITSLHFITTMLHQINPVYQII